MRKLGIEGRNEERDKRLLVGCSRASRRSVAFFRGTSFEAFLRSSKVIANWAVGVFSLLTCDLDTFDDHCSIDSEVHLEVAGRVEEAFF